TSLSRPAKSRPAAGSSSNSSSGSVISARAICTRFRSPSESVQYARSARPATPNWLNSSWARCSSNGSYSSRHRPITDQAAVTTTSRTRSSAGIRSPSVAVLSPIRVRSSLRSVRPMRSPSVHTSPDVGCTRPTIRLSSVVLPAPLGPRMTHRSSGATRHVRSRSSGTPDRSTLTRPMSITESGSGVQSSLITASSTVGTLAIQPRRPADTQAGGRPRRETVPPITRAGRPYGIPQAGGAAGPYGKAAQRRDPVEGRMATDPGLRRLALRTLLAAFPGPTPPDWAAKLLADGLAGFLLFSSNIDRPERVAATTAALRAHRADVLIAIDEEGGDVT